VGLRSGRRRGENRGYYFEVVVATYHRERPRIAIVITKKRSIKQLPSACQLHLNFRCCYVYHTLARDRKKVVASQKRGSSTANERRVSTIPNRDSAWKEAIPAVLSRSSGNYRTFRETQRLVVVSLLSSEFSPRMRGLILRDANGHFSFGSAYKESRYQKGCCRCRRKSLLRA